MKNSIRRAADGGGVWYLRLVAKSVCVHQYYSGKMLQQPVGGEERENVKGRERNDEEKLRRK